MEQWIIVAIICFVLYEIVEHLLLPLYWAIRNRKQASVCGPDSMLGRSCVVKQWHGTYGKVAYQNELWNAECKDDFLRPGSSAKIIEVRGLTLKVAPLEVGRKL